MSSPWRAAGLTYVRYSNICAKVVRQGLKSNVKVEAAKRENSVVKCLRWINGAPSQA